ncbi:MAG: hypothetical protein ABL921_00110, partial [Pirellula sp.]
MRLYLQTADASIGPFETIAPTNKKSVTILIRLARVYPLPACEPFSMDVRYSIQDTSEILSPALVVFEELLRSNLQKMVAIAGGVQRLRPHCKTHKMREVAEMELQLGIAKHKCATLAEAEMLATA